MFNKINFARFGLLALGLAVTVTTADAGALKLRKSGNGGGGTPFVGPFNNTLQRNIHPSQKPDLVLTPAYNGVGPSLNHGFCGLSGGMVSVMFRVSNSGPKPSPHTTAKVTFSIGGSTNVNIGAMSAGSNGHIYAVAIPQPGPVIANFTVEVDPDNNVSEKSYINNNGSGSCSTQVGGGGGG